MKKSYLLLCAAPLAISTFAVAQEVTPAADAAVVEEDQEVVLSTVRVTSNKREQSLSDVSSAVQAVGGEELESRQLSDLTRIANEIPSATINQALTPSFTIVQMRGSGGLGQTGDPAVSFYLDEVPFFVPNLQISPLSNTYDLQRIEVLRGPQGTIWGQGSMGGAIRYLTNDPDTEAFDASARASIYSMEDGDTGGTFDAMVNIPVSDTFAVRVVGGYEEIPGFADIVTPTETREDLNGVEGYNLRVKALWTPNEKTSISAMYWHIDSEQEEGNALVQLEPPLLDPGGSGFFDGITDVYNLTGEFSFDQFDLISSTSLLEYETNLRIGVTVPMGIGPLLFDQSFDTSNFTQEVRLVSNGSGPFNWIVGGSYSNAELDVGLSQTYDNLLFQSIIGTDQESVVKTESFAVFGEVFYELMDGKLIPAFGLRYYTDDRSNGGQSTIARGVNETNIVTMTCDPAINAFAGVNCETLLPPFGAEDTFESVNPRFNLAYHANDNLLLYTNIARGFRSGTVQSQAQVAAGAFAGVTTDVTIDDDSVWSYEVGGKYQSDDGRFSAELVGFIADYQDAQVFFSSAGVGVAATGGDYQTQGIEVGLGYRPNASWNFTATGAVIDSEWQDVPQQIELNVPDVGTGLPVAYTPEWDINLSARHDGQFANSDWGHFQFLGVSARDAQFATQNAPGGTIEDISARVGLTKNNWEVSLFANNLLDDRGPIYQSSNLLQYGLTPRTVGVTLRVRK